MSEASKEHLLEVWRISLEAQAWLRRSYGNSPKPPYLPDMPAEDWDQLEALAGRYARLTDLVIHKLFRAIDRYEFEETSSLVDAANKAAKRGLVESPDVLRELKDIRNEIVHEYAIDALAELYGDIHVACAHLFDLMYEVQNYLKQRHGIDLSD